MAGRLSFVVLALLALLVPAASALPASGQVLAEGALALEGPVRGRLDSGGFALLDPQDAALEGSATLVNVTLRAWREVRVTNALTGDVQYTREDETNWFEGSDAALGLGEVGSGARLLLQGEALGARVSLDGSSLAGWRERVVVPSLAAVDGKTSQQFSWVVTDSVTADAASGSVDAGGDATLYVWNATLLVDDREFRTGVFEESRAGALPIENVKETRYVWALVRLEGANVALSGGNAVVSGVREYALDGKMTAERASADFDVDGVPHAARDASFRLLGAVSVTPFRVAEGSRALLADEAPDPVVAAGVRGDVRELSAGPAEARDPRWVAGAAAGGVLLLGFLGWAAYTRLSQPELLDNDVRAQIYKIVCENPGIGAREVHRRSGRSWGTVVYHLRQLEKHNLVKSKAFGRLRNYYENHGKWGGQETMLAALKGEKTLRIARAILARPGVHQDHLVETTGLPQSTVSYRVKRLRESGLVEERREARFASYFPGPDLERLLELREAEPDAGDDVDDAPAAA